MSNVAHLPPALLEPSVDLAGVCGPITEAARELARSIDLSRAVDRLLNYTMTILVPERREDSVFREAVRTSASDAFDAVCRVVSGQADLHTRAGVGPKALAEIAVEVGLSGSELERIYRVGGELLWGVWHQEAVAFAERTGAPLAELTGPPSMIIFAYLDAVLSPIMRTYDPSSANVGLTRDRLRRSLLMQALEGKTTLDAPDIELTLGVPLEGEHLAFLIKGHDPERGGLIEVVMEAAGASRCLTHRHAVEAWLVWLSRRAAFDRRLLARVRDPLERLGARVAIGDPRFGAEGLGATGRDAIEAARLQTLLGSDAPSVISYADVRMEAVLLADPERARRFVRDELGPLDTYGARAREHRNTALIWLTVGSHVSTAAQLGVHEHTVRNRIAHIEEMLGYGLTTRRAELLAALRVQRMLAAQAASADGTR
jgi:hypothetical protein